MNSSKTQILAGVSHEIRNPLNAIIGISHLLKNTTSKEQQDELIETLLQTSENLLELTNNILDFSKLEDGNPKFTNTEVNLRKTIKRALFGQIKMAEAKGLKLKIEIDNEVPKRVIVDKVKFTQILMNLISNAIKFTKKGSVTLRIKNKNLSASKVNLTCAVIDTGIGISEENFENIFIPFHQGSPDVSLKYGGTGLGLSICQELVSAMGGDLKLQSELKKGSEFIFGVELELPEGSSERRRSIADEIPSEKELNKGLRVLVVDDNEINLLVAKKNLEMWKVGYDLARDGLEAVEKMMNQDFDMVFMDLYMPKMDGFDATSAIRNLLGGKFESLPIIALSGSTEPSFMEELEATGFTDFLNKPFRPQELLERLLLFQPKEMVAAASAHVNLRN